MMKIAEKNKLGVSSQPLENGLIFDESMGMYPSQLIGYDGSGQMEVGCHTSTVFGYVSQGDISLVVNGRNWDIELGYYFSVVGPFTISGTGKAVLFRRYGFRGTFNIGGPVENRGRLAYIDGCSDSLLIHSPRLGDPCLNLLVFPKNTRQTMHIHPSIRLGMVISGEGRCITPQGEIPLQKGNVFCLKEMEKHCFYTDDSEMRIVAYHPDSDWGPTDENHPMLNRTLFEK